MKTHSCCTALLKMTKDWRNSIDNKEAVAAVAVDLSKAFDAINHSLLLAKLKAYGFSPHALELMSTYLLGRQQCVRLEGVCSNFKTVNLAFLEVHCWGRSCSTYSLMTWITVFNQSIKIGRRERELESVNQRVTLVRKVKSNWHVFPACKNWLNLSFWGQFEIKILIVRHI